MRMFLVRGVFFPGIQKSLEKTLVTYLGSMLFSRFCSGIRTVPRGAIVSNDRRVITQNQECFCHHNLHPFPAEYQSILNRLEKWYTGKRGKGDWTVQVHGLWRSRLWLLCDLSMSRRVDLFLDHAGECLFIWFWWNKKNHLKKIGVILAKFDRFRSKILYKTRCLRGIWRTNWSIS